MNNEKPVVQYYDIDDRHPAIEGYSAYVIPVDHPREHLNGQVCTTSTVLKVGENGSFETRNTNYVKAKV